MAIKAPTANDGLNNAEDRVVPSVCVRQCGEGGPKASTSGPRVAERIVTTNGLLYTGDLYERASERGVEYVQQPATVTKDFDRLAPFYLKTHTTNGGGQVSGLTPTMDAFRSPFDSFRMASASHDFSESGELSLLTAS